MDAGTALQQDRNRCRGQAPWTWRYRVIGASLAFAGALFLVALITGQSEAFVPLAGFAGTVITANIAGAVAEDCLTPQAVSFRPGGAS